MARSRVHCEILPPFVLARLVLEGPPDVRAGALRTLQISAAIQARRALVASLIRAGVSPGEIGAAEPGPPETITVYDLAGGGDADLPGTRARGTGDPPASDPAVNGAYDGADATYRLYRETYDRNSIDGIGMEMVSSVHYGHDYDNAFWNGTQMVYGDGSGQVFRVGALTASLDVIGHELTHGVTQYTAALEYRGQPGALNESWSDVFGSLVRQRHLDQTADRADWLIGPGTLGTALHGVALRSMKAPGTAFDGDPQPATMSGYKRLPEDDDPSHDNGGVHINSGIPNHAFYLAATAIGGRAWEGAGRVWYRALTSGLRPTSTFRDAADATVAAAGELFGAGGREAKAVQDAWRQVEVLPAA